jgi:hypothetical protein
MVYLVSTLEFAAMRTSLQDHSSGTAVNLRHTSSFSSCQKNHFALFELFQCLKFLKRYRLRKHASYQNLSFFDYCRFDINLHCER